MLLPAARALRTTRYLLQSLTERPNNNAKALYLGRWCICTWVPFVYVLAKAAPIPSLILSNSNINGAIAYIGSPPPPAVALCGAYCIAMCGTYPITLCGAPQHIFPLFSICARLNVIVRAALSVRHLFNKRCKNFKALIIKKIVEK